MARRPTPALVSEVAPREEHYATCSPWQTLPYDAQITRKTEALAKAFAADAGQSPTVAGFHAAPETFGYRTKMVFSFMDEGEQGLALAFHGRGGRSEMVELPDGCVLGSAATNAAALGIADQLWGLGVEADSLKTLVIREGVRTQCVVAALYVKDPNFPAEALNLAELSGLTVIYSRPNTSDSVTTTVLREWGELGMTERVHGMTLSYPFDGFFQNNLPVFEQALTDLAEALSPVDQLMELYAGVGTIGLHVRDRAARILGVELDQGGTAAAEENAIALGVEHYETLTMPAQGVQREQLMKCDALIVDPPRGGLAPKLVHRIADAGPPQLLYLSCNPETQARDFRQLRHAYAPVSLRGYDFFPHTPHIESLLVLRRTAAHRTVEHGPRPRAKRRPAKQR
jgi:tRNA/tmRNA/rRNA uracil-C5-methylase (TrmA/RlmC/RlmD family)